MPPATDRAFNVQEYVTPLGEQMPAGVTVSVIASGDVGAGKSRAIQVILEALAASKVTILTGVGQMERGRAEIAIVQMVVREPEDSQDVKHMAAIDIAWAKWRDTNLYLEPSREAVMLAFSAGFSAAVKLCAEATERERLEQAKQTNTERLIGIQFAQQAVGLALEG